MHFIKRITVVTEYWSCIDSLVDFEERHADSIQIAISKCPKAPVRISIFRTNAWMHNKSALGRNREDCFFQQDLATCQNKIRFQPPDKCFRLWRIRPRCLENLGFRCDFSIDKALSSQLLSLPSTVISGKKNTVIQSERENVEKTKNSNSLHLAPHAAPKAVPGLLNDHDANEIRERIQ